METRLLSILRCAKCRGVLSLAVYEHAARAGEVEAGLLACGACDMRYAVWRGVPRMVPEEDFRLPRAFVTAYRERMAADLPRLVDPGKTWETNPYDIPWSLDDGAFDWSGLDAATRIAYVHHYLHIPPGSLEGRLVLDAGCGNGALSAAIAREGAEVVAFDYSDIVERAALNGKLANSGSHGGKVHYLQADVQHPPFADRAFDLLYSDGVVHLAEDPRQAVHALAGLLKPKGRMFVSVSRRGLGAGDRARGWVVDLLQEGFRRIPAELSKPVCLAGAGLRLMQGHAARWLGRPTRPLGSLRHEAIMLWNVIALPRHQYYVPTDLSTWFLEEGLSDVQERTIPSLGRTGFGILGVREAQPHRESHSSSNATPARYDDASKIGTEAL